MIDILFQSINVLPSVLMLALLIYFYSQKRIPGLLLLLIGYIVITLVTIASNFGVVYMSSRAYTAVEIRKFYTVISIISMLTQLITVIGMGILLQNYPVPKDKEKIADSF